MPDTGSHPGHQIRVTAVVVEEDSVLLVKQRVGDREWSLPGGRLENGEIISDALVREVREETGLEVAPNRFLYLNERPEDRLINVTFSCDVVGGVIRLPSNEYDSNPISDVRFVPIRALEEYGFPATFRDLLKTGFPNAGLYMGLKRNAGP